MVIICGAFTDTLLAVLPQQLLACVKQPGESCDSKLLSSCVTVEVVLDYSMDKLVLLLGQLGQHSLTLLKQVSLLKSRLIFTDKRGISYFSSTSVT